MAKMFLTGGNNGMWKRRKLSSITHTYVDFDLDTSTGTATTEFDFNTALDILKNNGLLFAKIHVSGIPYVFSAQTAVHNFDENQKIIIFVTPNVSADYESTSETHAIYWNGSSVLYKKY